MAGKLEVEVPIKSSAPQYWEVIKDSTTLLPKHFPDQYKSIDVLEGDGKSAGSVRLTTYAESSPLIKVSKEKIDSFDEANYSVSYSVIDGDLLKLYKSFKGHIVVVPKEEGCLVKWSCEYEKASDDVDDPHAMKDLVVKNFVEMDDILRK